MLRSPVQNYAFINYGCDPTKTMIHIASLLYHARHADQFGLHISGAKVDWASVMSWVHQVQQRIRGGTSEEVITDLSHKGIDVLQGEASFVSPHELSVAGRIVSAARIIIATGGQNFIPPIEGLNEVGFITNVHFSDPALAHVGKTEEQLRQEKVEYRAARMYFKDVERAIAEGTTDGLVKLLVDKQGKFLGGHILAPGAGDLLAPVILAMQADLPAEAVASTIMPYPTMVEGVRWVADR